VRALRVAVLGFGVVTLGGLALLLQILRDRPQRPPAPRPGRHAVRVTETRRIVPGPGLPPEVVPAASNNNLDVVRHEGRVYLAFRTAPHHFANPETVIHVVSSEDERSWRSEARFAVGADLREPRLLSFGGALFLYVSQLGFDPLAFEPRGMAFSERRADGAWTDLEALGPPGVMGWRVRIVHGHPVFAVYEGGDDLYSGRRPRLRVELWRSDDGRRWAPYDPEHPVVYEGGGSEADFALRPDGSLVGVIRNEGGDDTGWGSKVCTAPADALARWQCESDPRKFDSPFAFAHDAEVYLVARRQVAHDGRYDLGRGPGWLLHTLWNQVNYSLTPKRCALWRWIPEERTFGFVLDLPSRGDTCFPAVLEGDDPAERIVYDYSSDLEGEDLRWLQGQRGPTSIYRHVLRFDAR